MLSSDKNVETIAQLVETLKNYIGLQKEFVKLDVIEKVVHLVTAVAIAIVFILLGGAVLFYLSFAVIHWLAPYTGLAMAYFIVAVAFLILIIFVFANRKAWIEQPLVRFLTSTLLN